MEHFRPQPHVAPETFRAGASTTRFIWRSDDAGKLVAAPPPYDNEILLEQEWGIVMMRSIGPLELLTLLVAIAVLAIVVAFPAGRICRRAGYSPWLGLLALIPVCNVILLWFLAFAEWPGRRDA